MRRLQPVLLMISLYNALIDRRETITAVIYNGQTKKDKRTNNDLKNITHKTKHRVTWTPLTIGGELICSGRVTSSCSTSGARRVNLDTNPVISHEWGKDRELLTTRWTYPWSFVTQIFRNGQLSHGGDRKTFEVMTST